MSDANMMLNRAKSALIAHDFPLAAKIYKNLILEEPDNISYKMALGNLYVKAGKDDQALTIFKQIEKADNENFDALSAISGIYRRQKKYEESVAVLEQALVICKNDMKSRAKISYNLGFTYRLMGNYDDAINCFEEVVEENPSDVLANNHLGAIYALQGNHDKAIEAYHRGLKFDPNHPILQFNIAKSYAETGETQKALSFYEGALRAKPGWTEAIEAYADLLLGENKVSEADEVVTQALKINPDDVKMHTAKGNVFNRQSIFDHAEVEYKKALDVDESYRNALTGLAHSLENQGKVEEAVETIAKAEKLNPNDIKIMKQSAHIHISANKLDSAYEKISKLQEINKNDLQTMNLLGQYYIVSDEPQKAEDCFASIKKINPDYNEVYRDWGERFIQNGDEKRAEPYLQAAIQKNPNDAKAMISLGNLYEKQNLMGKALQFYKKANSADSYNQLSKNAAARILGDEENLPVINTEYSEPRSVDYDSLFSGGKIESDFSDLEAQSAEAELPELTEENIESPLDIVSDSGEISLANDDSSFDEEILEPEDDFEEQENLPAGEDELDSEQFSIDKLAEPVSDVEDVDSLADLIDPDIDIEDVDEEDLNVVEVETPSAQKREISDESLDMLEAQIKKATELAENAWKVASQVPGAAQIIGEMKNDVDFKSEELPETEENVEEAPAAEEIPVEEENQESSEEELNADEELADSDLLSAGELLTEDDISEAETEEDDFLEDIPDYLQEDEEETVAESSETEENNNTEDESEKEEFSDAEEVLEDEIEEKSMEEAENTENTPKVDDLTLRRAIDMLPSIIAAIEDRSVIYRFRSFLSMFETLREMLEYLPEEQKHEFMTSRNRLLLDYVISKLSGKPGLYATTKALLRSGLIHENPENKASEKEGIELVKEVLGNLRKLSENLKDETLKVVINAEADSLEGNI